MKPKELKTPPTTPTSFKKNAKVASLQRRKKKKQCASSQIQAFQSVHLWSTQEPDDASPSKLIFEFLKSTKIPKEGAYYSPNVSLVLNLIENERIGSDSKTGSRTARELLVNCNEDPYLASNNPESMPAMKKANFTAKPSGRILTETNKNYTKMLHDLVVRL